MVLCTWTLFGYEAQAQKAASDTTKIPVIAKNDSTTQKKPAVKTTPSDATLQKIENELEIDGLVLDETNLDALELDDILHPPVVVPLTKKVDEMFDFFTANDARAAVVLNEFGGVEGIVTMKDVLTFIFGQISGDVEGQELYRERDEDTYDVSGEMKLTDFNNLTNFGIEDPRMTTIAGVAFRHLDRLPQVGDSISIEGITITVLKMDEQRIARVRVNRGGRVDVDVPAGEAPAEASAEAVDEQVATTHSPTAASNDNDVATDQSLNTDAVPDVGGTDGQPDTAEGKTVH